MLPSASDRQTWFPIILFLILLLVVVMIAGGGSWLLNHAAPPINLIMRATAAIFWVSLFIHIILLLPIYVARLLMEQVPVLISREKNRAH